METSAVAPLWLVGRASEYSTPVLQGVVAGYVVMGLLVLWLGLCYLAVFVDEATLFGDVAKWPRVLVVLSLVMNTWLEVSQQLAPYVPSLWRLHGTCQALMVLHWAVDAWLFVNLFLASLERLISLWLGDPDRSGFDKATTVGLLVGGGFIAVVWSVASLYADGTGPRLAPYGNTSMCVLPYHNFTTALKITRTIEWISLLLVAMMLTGRLCHSRLHDHKPYPRNQIAPIAVADLIMVIAILLSEELSFYGLDVALARLFVMAVILLGESDMRLAYRKMCCSCCPLEEEEGERMQLLGVRMIPVDE